MRAASAYTFRTAGWDALIRGGWVNMTTYAEHGIMG
jgi:hypothetical protein